MAGYTNSAPTAGQSTILESLSWRAAQQPDLQAYTFLGPDGAEVGRLTYAQLDRKARTIATRLREFNGKGERVLLLYPPGLEFVAAIFGCLFAGAVAVPASPPRGNRITHHLHTIVADAQAKLALTTSAILPGIAEQTNAPTRDLCWLSTDDLVDETGAEGIDPVRHDDALALLQYTSGSTTAPKGVMVTRRNLQHNMSLIGRAFQLTEEDVGVFWLPSTHDMGLIGGVLGPAYLGVPVVLMSPTTFLQRPVNWLGAFAKYQGTIGGGPNFAFDFCVQKVPPEDLEDLDLSSWRVAFCGAEPIRAKTLDRFARFFAPSGFRPSAFYPCFGLAETTLIASGGAGPGVPVVRRVLKNDLERGRAIDTKEDEEGAQTLVGCGRVLPDMDIVIVDPETSVPCPAGHVGEIWLSGPSVAGGYWNRPAESAESFRARVAGDDDKTFLRTGDLGFILDEQLFVTGRLKDLIVIRGRNHYPQDIETAVEECHEALRANSGAAFSVDVSGGECLVVVQEVRRESVRTLNVDEAVGAIRSVIVREFELSVYAVVLVKPMRIPKTTSGKIQRRLCRAWFLDDKLATVGKWVAGPSGNDDTDAPA